MEIRVLKYFLTVARCENITKAAEELHLTQPTLSRQLSELEKELGTPLLVRGKKRTTLTEAGYFLKDRAEEILTLTKKTKEDFARSESLIAGHVYIGCGETEAMAEVAGVLTQVAKKYPKIQYHLVSGDEKVIYDELQKGILDFGLVCRAEPPQNYIYRKLSHDDRWGLMMREDHPLAKKPAVTFQDLAEEPLLISEQVVNNKELDHYFGDHLDNLHIIGTYNLTYNTIFFANAGLASVLSFESLAHVVGQRYHFAFRPLTPALVSHNYLIWKKDPNFSRAGKIIEEAFIKAFRK